MPIIRLVLIICFDFCNVSPRQSNHCAPGRVIYSGISPISRLSWCGGGNFHEQGGGGEKGTEVIAHNVNNNSNNNNCLFCMDAESKVQYQNVVEWVLD
jgi:hypothetical protein